MTAQVTLDQGKLARLLGARNSLARRSLQKRLDKVADYAREEAAGGMARYISTDIVETSRGLQGVVECTHPKARLLIEGTRPHLIRPRRAKALRFEVGGEVVFTRLVRHPRHPFQPIPAARAAQGSLEVAECADQDVQHEGGEAAADQQGDEVLRSARPDRERHRLDGDGLVAGHVPTAVHVALVSAERAVVRAVAASHRHRCSPESLSWRPT
uniref:hypothetical protein n=1 Tax=Streptomyces longwoodensis TaxID=68231 RepID=UPI002F914EF7